MRDALSPVMAVTRIPSSSLSLSTRRSPLAALAPRIFERVLGGLLELAIHAVESWRDRRPGVAR